MTRKRTPATVQKTNASDRPENKRQRPSSFDYEYELKKDKKDKRKVRNKAIAKAVYYPSINCFRSVNHHTMHFLLLSCRSPLYGLPCLGRGGLCSRAIVIFSCWKRWSDFRAVVEIFDRGCVCVCKPDLKKETRKKERRRKLRVK
jgi:hypothetical protein